MLTENVKRSMIFASVACMAALIAACSSSSGGSTSASPSALSPASESAGGRFAPFAVGDTTTSTPEAGKIKVCKVGNVNGTFTISTISGGAPPTLIASPFSVATTVCRVVATDTSVAPINAALVAVTETSAGLVSATIQPQGGVPAPYLGQATVNAIHGATITFNNFVAPPPPPATQGCSPGYFKTHEDTPTFNRSQTLDSVLQTSVFPSTLTVGDALSLKGGGVNALARHAAAAILNSVALDGNYAYTLAQLRAIFDKVDLGTLSIEDASNLLESKEDNETTILCPLN